MKHLLTFLLMLFVAVVSAQNLQLHYDFGKARDKNAMDREYVTATVEFFKPDKYGSTFFFVDFDFNGKDNGINLSYLELARNLKITQDFPIQAHLEYNGGHVGADGFGAAFRNMFLVGGYYDLHLTKNFSIGTMLAYKYIQHVENGADFQLTLTWAKPLGKRFLFTGFVDLWTEDATTKDQKKFVFLTEPQLWFALNKHFRIGSEIEISHNFVVGSSKLEVMPTVALRWDI